MAVYGYAVGKSLDGGSIELSIGWEHKKSELEILCVQNDTNDYKVINAGRIEYFATTDKYVIKNPFNDKSIGWTAIVWRETDSSQDVAFLGNRIPIEAIVEKLEELTRKADENAQEARRAIRTPEGDSEQFVPEKDFRAGRILGFNEDGDVAVGKNIPEVREFFSHKIDVENLVNEAKTHSDLAARFRDEAEHFAGVAGDYADDSQEWAEKSQSYALNSQSWLGKVQTAGTNALNEIEISKNSAISVIDGKIGDTLDAAKLSAERAEQAAQEAFDSEEQADEHRLRCEELAQAMTAGVRIEVVATRPTTGENNVFYFVGNDTNGYDNWVYSGNRWVHMGHTNFSALRPATVNQYGLIRLGTSVVMTNDAAPLGLTESGQAVVRKMTQSVYGTGKLSTAIVADFSTYEKSGGFIAMNNSNQLIALAGTINRFGAVKLGSEYQPTHAMPYVVGIGASTNAGKIGQIAFNLKETQSDGSPGCLRYTKKGNGQSGYHMWITEASESQMGIMKMCHSLNDLTEEEIDAMRNTHAASVGLVVDGLNSFAEDFFTDGRIEGYFDNWARGKNLSDEIWNNEEYRTAILDNLSNSLVENSAFQNLVESYVITHSTDWLKKTITDEYIDGMFLERVYSRVDEMVDDRWTRELDRYINEVVESKTDIKLGTLVQKFFDNPANIKNVAKLISYEISDDIVKSAEAASVDYIKSVFAGKEMITVGGEKVSFEEWASKEIEQLIFGHTESLSKRVDVLEKNSGVHQKTEELYSNSSGTTSYTFNNLLKYRYVYVETKATKAGWGTSTYSLVLDIDHVKKCRELKMAKNAFYSPGNGYTLDDKYGANDTVPILVLDGNEMSVYSRTGLITKVYGIVY